MVAGRFNEQNSKTVKSMNLLMELLPDGAVFSRTQFRVNPGGFQALRGIRN